MAFYRWLSAALLALAVLGGAPGIAAAQTSAAQQLSPAEAEDFKAYTATMEDFGKYGFAGVNAHLPALHKALDRAPAEYPALEAYDDYWIIRGDSSQELFLFTTLAMAAANKSGKGISVKQQPNVYPMVAFMLGSEATERGAYDEAIGYMDRGLRLQPNQWLLLTEKAAALHGQHKWAEALALVDAALASNDPLIAMNAGSLYRKRGFSLVELGRLPEARQAYEKSLETDPGHKVALAELEYIKGLEAGMAPTAMTLEAPGGKGP